ncbi:hypothetical protein LY76DRAFT_136481 [Colletotrichum caudatum]|nr:hypothetical protein LY76DRAFT_136481 [Colletotrichum caudatum]
MIGYIQHVCQIQGCLPCWKRLIGPARLFRIHATPRPLGWLSLLAPSIRTKALHTVVMVVLLVRATLGPRPLYSARVSPARHCSSPQSFGLRTPHVKLCHRRPSWRPRGAYCACTDISTPLGAEAGTTGRSKVKATPVCLPTCSPGCVRPCRGVSGSSDSCTSLCFHTAGIGNQTGSGQRAVEAASMADSRGGIWPDWYMMAGKVGRSSWENTKRTPCAVLHVSLHRVWTGW